MGRLSQMLVDVHATQQMKGIGHSDACRVPLYLTEERKGHSDACRLPLLLTENGMGHLNAI